MSKKVKSLITDELSRHYAGVDSVLLVNPIGLSAVDTNRLRGRLKEKGIRLSVVRNGLLGRAVADGPLAPLVGRLAGSNAIADGGDSIVDVAKEFVALKKGLPALQIVGAVVEGEAMGAAQAAGLANMPSKVEMQGAIAMLAMSPGSRLAGALVGGFRMIAGCIEAIVEKAEKEQGSEPEQASAQEQG